ncbi:MAG: M20/M25/M40 family metallo-hydrolase [Bacteroidetes bacterium]|nr:M20/M25/M40 family metallo-hydrolase [Bacteroidota bacterium]
MSNFYKIIFCFFIATSCYSNTLHIAPIPASLLEQITETKAREHINFLASDEMFGRNTPSPELEKSADYIASYFKKVGVEPINGTYFHNYKLFKVNLGKSNVLKIKTPDSIITMNLKDDFIPFDATGAASLLGKEIVFVGYGITAPEYGYDDYAGIDVKGKIVVVIRGAPKLEDTNSVFSMRKGGIRFMTHEAKATTAINNGAVGMIVFSNPKTSHVLRATGFPWPSLFPKMSADALPLKVKSIKDLPMANFPIIHCNEKVAVALFGTVDKLKSAQIDIDSQIKPSSFALPNVSIKELTVTTDEQEFTVRNVMGIVKGAEKPNEYVVVGGHYDHVGFTQPNDPTKDSVFNGADDNASGTTGVLLMAESFAKSQQKPKRSLVFVAFSGEEKGLLGSQAFTETPPLPLENCVAMLNMDMIGRAVNDSLCIGGNTRCKELSELNEEENKQLATPFSLNYTIENFFFRSDQANFAKKQIPVLFYFTGEHSDYHKVSDEISKINFPDLVRITKLCARTAWKTASLDERLPYTPQKSDRMPILR